VTIDALGELVDPDWTAVAGDTVACGSDAVLGEGAVDADGRAAVEQLATTMTTATAVAIWRGQRTQPRSARVPSPAVIDRPTASKGGTA
jgi:hypothetical protein